MRKQLLFIAIVLLALTALAQGQSGRKQKKADPTPPVQGVNQPELRTQPEPEIQPEAEAKKKEPPRTLMAMTELPEIGISSFYPDMARRGFLEEAKDLIKGIMLREATNQNRSDAIKAAKDSDDTWVVLMEFRVDNMTSSSYGGFELRYTLYEAKTGKMIGSGVGYPQQPRSRVPMPPIGGNRPEILADWAGRDVAYQVLRRLGWIQ